MSNPDNYWLRNQRSALSRRRFLTGAGGLAVGGAAFLAGCSSSNNNNNSGNTSNAAKSAASSAPATRNATASAAGAAATARPSAATAAAGVATAAAGKRGGKIVTTKAAHDTGLDPAITVTNPVHPAKAYSHLLVFQASTNQYFLDLAQSFEQTDPTTMTFKLRPGLKFAPTVAGGRALTAQDIAYSYGRFPDTLKNFGSEVNALQWSWMDSFATPDDQTLVIKLKAPYASAIPSLGSSAFAVVARELVEANGGKLSDVMNAGSGPYMMTKRDDTSTLYERNPNYYKHSPAQGPFVEEGPYIDQWQELIIQDAATIEARFLAGDTDIYALPPDKIKAQQLGTTKGVVVAKATNPTNNQFQLDSEKWLQHPLLAQAVSLAIDRDAYIKTLLLGEGQYGSPVGPIFDSVLTQDQLKGYQKFDPAQAKALWAQGNGNTVFPNGLRTTSATFSPDQTQQVDFIKRQLESVLGIKVNVTPTDLAAYVSLATARQKDWEFYVASENSLSTIPDYNALTFYVPSGYGAIFGNLRLDSPVPEVAAYAKKSADMFAAQAQELDHSKRVKLLQDMQVFYLTNYAPALPLPVPQFSYGAYRDRVKNWPEKDAPLGNSSTGVNRVQNLYLNS